MASLNSKLVESNRLTLGVSSVLSTTLSLKCEDVSWVEERGSILFLTIVVWVHFLLTSVFFSTECKLGQSEPSSMTAPVGRSVLRSMGCVFHPPLHPTLTQHSNTVNFFACCWPLTFSLGPKIFPTLTLHTTLPPSYPTNLPTLLTYLLA
jgi:hypothetical protein